MEAIELTEEDKRMFEEMVTKLFPFKKGKEGNVSVNDIIPYGLLVSIDYDDGTRRIHWYEFMERFLSKKIHEINWKKPNLGHVNCYEIMLKQFPKYDPTKDQIRYLYTVFKELKL